jgi:hypothetical protein
LLAMKSIALDAMAKPTYLNPLTWLWCILLASRVRFYSFLEYFKLAKIIMVQDFGSVEDE